MDIFIEKLRKTLLEEANEQDQLAAKRFFKEELKNYGIKNPGVQKIAKDLYPGVKDRTKSEIMSLCEELWQSRYFEESLVACFLTEKLQRQFEPADFAVFERWINNYVGNWASCDTLCNHTVGDFVMKYPEFITKLKAFAYSENRWMKRAAAVSLIIPARKGFFLSDIFDIADILLIDKDDLVQKGYGWMLKSASEVSQNEVFEFVIKRKDKMPRTALRYAIEKMPPELRRQAMSK